jgi:hypothetical protein
VDAALGAEQAVCVLAAGDERRRLDPRLLSLGGLLHLDAEPTALGPAQIHPQQHLGPVLGVSPPGPRADGDHRVAGVVAAAEESRLLELGEPALDRGELGVELGGELGIVLGELDEIREVADVRFELAKRLESPLGPRVGGRGRSRAPLVVPEAGRLHLPLEPP